MKAFLDFCAFVCYLIGMLDKKIQNFIQDNGLERIQASPMSEAFDLWECAGGHVWTFDMIKESVNAKESFDALKLFDEEENPHLFTK